MNENDNDYTGSTPEEREHSKQEAIDRLRNTDEYMLLARGVSADGEEGILVQMSAPIGSYPQFANAMGQAQLKMVHTALGAMLEDEGTIDISHELQPLPQPESIDVPDFVPDFSSDDWNKPGGEFPKGDN